MKTSVKVLNAVLEILHLLADFGVFAAALIVLLFTFSGISERVDLMKK